MAKLLFVLFALCTASSQSALAYSEFDQENPLAAMGTGPDSYPRVYYVDEVFQIMELAWSEAAQRWDLRNVSAESGAPAAADYSPLAAVGVGFDRSPRVYYFDRHRQVRELAWSEATLSWKLRNLSAETGAPPARAVQEFYELSPIAVTAVDDNRSPRVYYLDEDFQIQELAWSEAAQQWHVRNLSAETGAPPIDNSPIVAMATGANRSPRVYYSEKPRFIENPPPLFDQLIPPENIELAWSEATQRWSYRSTNNAAFLLGPGSPMVALGAGVDSAPRVYFEGMTDIFFETAPGFYESAWSEDAQRWTENELPSGSHDFGVSMAAMAAGPDRSPRVYHFSNLEGLIWERAWSETEQQWNVRNLRSVTGAPRPMFDSPLAAMGAGLNRYPRVYYFDPDRQIHELAWFEETQIWSSTNVSVVAKPLFSNVNQLVRFQAEIPGEPWSPDGCPDDFPGGRYSFTAKLENASDEIGPYTPQGKSLTAVLVAVQDLTGDNRLLTGDGVLVDEGSSFAVPRVDDYMDGILSTNETVNVPFSVCLRAKERFALFVNVLAVQK